MKVLIGVDGSPDGFAAARQAGQLLSATRDQVALYYTPPVLHDRHATPEILERARRALTDAVFNEAKAELPEDLRANVHTIVGEQKPGPGLLAAADEWKADMIVVGARGAGPIETLLLGSVSRAVVHGARVPVLVVRKRRGATAGELKILLACDESPASRYAATLIERLAFPPQASGRAVTVIETMFAGELPQWLEEKARSADAEAMAQAWVREHDEEKKQTHERLTSYCHTLPPPFSHCDPLVAEGYPAEQILAAAASEQADLIIIGAHGKGALERLLMGSTSEKVLHHAPCSVLVVREPVKP